MSKTKQQAKKTAFSFQSITRLFSFQERTFFIFGGVLLFVGTFIIMSMFWFFTNGKDDYSLVADKSFWEILTTKTSVANPMGAFGAIIAEYLINKWYGVFSLFIPLFIVFLGLKFMKIFNKSLLRLFFIFCYLILVGSISSAFISSFFTLDNHIHWGGAHGKAIVSVLQIAMGKVGTGGLIVLLIAIFLIALKVISPSRIKQWMLYLKLKRSSAISVHDSHTKVDEQSLSDTQEQQKTDFQEKEEDISNSEVSKEEDTPSELISPPAQQVQEQNQEQPMVIDDNFEIVVPENEQQDTSNTPFQTTHSSQKEQKDDAIPVTEVEEYDPTLDLSHYEYPSTELLKYYEPSSKGIDLNEQKENKERITTTLKNYGIEITSIKATVGPTITLYEIVPQAGVRISKIRNLEDDIALSLSALGIRIIAPMPGKGTIGIEVPNKDPQIVSMQSVIASKRFQECNYDLPVALGRTITNDVFIFDLCKMPHLLVAGATGQGKSVGLNAIISSLLYKKHPAEMKMVLVDPKMVEFNIYSAIEKHYLAKLPDAEKAIITDVTKVTQTLQSLTKEMDDRYELLMEASVRTIKEYNLKFKQRKLNPLKGHRYLPYIVVIIDEFGDLIMTAGKEIEMPIARIAQKARAVGIHMIIATQRPTTNIITGTIKANFPARMAFRVTSQIDSRTILDMAGANQLIGRGDLLFSQGADLVRIQCAFVDTPEVERIANHIGSQQGYPHAFELPEYIPESGEGKSGDIDLSDKDPLFNEVARLIVVHQQGSTSLIQRKFSIGYNRAGRLMDQLEAAGIVGPGLGSKPRDVLVADEYQLEQLLTQMK